MLQTKKSKQLYNRKVEEKFFFIFKVHTQMHKYKRELKKKSEFFLMNRVFKQWRKGESNKSNEELQSETSYTGTEN